MHILPPVIFVFLYNGSVFYAAGHPPLFFLLYCMLELIPYRHIQINHVLCFPLDIVDSN